MDVVWRRQAERDLQHVFDFVFQHDPGAAEQLCDRIERRVGQLRDHLTWVDPDGSPARLS